MRLVVEVMLIAAAVAGIVVFRQQGTPAGSGVNLYTSAAPVLVAIPAVIVVLRLYPLVLRGLLRALARTAGAPAFLGLARALAGPRSPPRCPRSPWSSRSPWPRSPAWCRDAVTNGEVAASWQAAGADVTVTPAPYLIIAPSRRRGRSPPCPA